MSDQPGPRSDHQDIDNVISRRRRRAIRGLFVVAVVVLVVAFVIQNSQRVTVHFWFFTHKARLIWVVLPVWWRASCSGTSPASPGRRAPAPTPKKAEEAAAVGPDCPG